MNAQMPGRFSAITAKCFQGRDNMLAFEGAGGFFQREPLEARGADGFRPSGGFGGRRHLPRVNMAEPFQQVFKFPCVARPVAGHQGGSGQIGKTPAPHTIADGILIEDVLEQQTDIVTLCLKERKINRQRVQAGMKFMEEKARLDQGL